jgi:hypothetical protein
VPESSNRSRCGLTLPVPNAAGVWGECPGSVPLSAMFPDLLPSESKQEGTAGHWVAHQVCTVGKPAIGTHAPNGWAVDEAMVDGGALFYTAIFAVANTRGGMHRQRYRRYARSAGRVPIHRRRAACLGV